MLYELILVVITFILGIGLKYFIAYLITKTPNLSKTKVEALRDIAIQFKFPKVKFKQ